MQTRHKRFHENIGSKREKGKTHVTLIRHLILPLRSGRDGQLIIVEAPLPVLQQLSAKEGLGTSADLRTIMKDAISQNGAPFISPIY